MPHPTASKSTTYDPFGDLRHRYPEWHIGLADLGGRLSEVVVAEDKMILIDPRGWDNDLQMAWAHVVSHLDHHMHTLGNLGPGEESEADYYAEVRLDRPGWLLGAGALDA